MNASGIVGGLFNFCIFIFFTCLIFFSKSGYMPCEQVLLWWAWNGYNILSTRKKKPTTEHTNGFPYYLIYTEWQGDIFTVILKLINIQLPFKIIISIALEKCLATFLGKNGECRLWSRLNLPHAVNHQCKLQFISLPLQWFF